MRQKFDAILIVTKIYFNNVCHKNVIQYCLSKKIQQDLSEKLGHFDFPTTSLAW